MRTPRKRLAVALPVLGLFLVLGACSSPPPPSVAANPCEPNPCLHPNRGQCAVVEGQAVCSCDPGTRLLEGGRCEVPHPCQPNPCTTPNQSVCSVSPEGQAVCACDSGYLPDGQGCRLEPRLTCSGEHTSGDAFEPDECPRLARPFGTQGDQEEAHTLEPASDEDWFRFTASEGRLLEIDARGEPGTKLLLSLHSGDGAEVLASELSGQPSVRLLWKAPATGEFLLRLLASGPEGGAYRLSLANRGVDDFVDTPEEVSSTRSTDGQPVTGALQYGGDRDVLRFSLQAGRSYRFDGAWLASGS
ncbi:MAG TPA: PPC domain-containing protein, partial [Myxococcaceae bacterium]|nr:PPC domain-containing protein [Myxococcaceae bacterium]